MYYLFLQLYALYPCSFLQYLKGRFGPTGEVQIYQECIAVSGYSCYRGVYRAFLCCEYMNIIYNKFFPLCMQHLLLYMNKVM